MKEFKKTESCKIYDKVYDDFIKLLKGEIDKVIISEYEIAKLNFLHPHQEVILDNNGNFICTYIDGRYNNYADTLREHFENKNIIQEYNPIDNTYIFRKDVNKCQN